MTKTVFSLPSMNQIAENLNLVRQQIERAARRVGRDPSSIRLVAVSKTKTVEEVNEAVEAGQFCFGESYAQELREKQQALSVVSGQLSVQLEWHFIGHLQKNKVKIVAPIVSWVESVDSLELAMELNKRATHPINCLIEVNVGGEDTKSGTKADQLENIVHGFGELTNLRLKGLMIIPPYSPDAEKSRPYFKKLKSLLSELNAANIGAEPLTELSMGMSHDFEVAIEEGATIVRVGTAIFGGRNKC